MSSPSIGYVIVARSTATGKWRVLPNIYDTADEAKQQARRWYDDYQIQPLSYRP